MLSLAALCIPGSAQESGNKPISPVIQYVTVDTATNDVTIYWEPSVSDSIESYVIGTIIEETVNDENPVAEEEGTVDAGTFTYTHEMDVFFPEYYVVRAVDSLGNNSLVGNFFHRPVELDLRYDSCLQRMELSWSAYLGWENQIAGYRVIINDPCGCADDVLLSPGRLSYIHEGVEENEHYAYTVIALHNQGYESYSNKKRYFTHMPPPPRFINLDYVSVVDDYSVEISFTPDLSGEINDFMILRSGAPDSEFAGWQTFPDADDTPIVVHDDIPAMGQQVYYRVDALNSCGRSIASSNVASNILLTGAMEGTVASLQWTPYTGFNGTLAGYRVYRHNEYEEFVEVANLPASSTAFSQDMAQIEYTQQNGGMTYYKGEVSYYIEAREAGDNPNGIMGISRSNALTLSVESHLQMPNAFTPGASPGINDEFKPVMDFIPETFIMVIFDRSGKKLFETRDPLTGWDGTVGGRGMAPQGVYIYHIEYTSFNGLRKQKTGSVSLVNP